METDATMGEVAHSSGQDGRSLGESLGPALVEHCGGKLRDLAWFRSSWQRGGAATGFGTRRNGDGREHGAMVKLPVGPAEFRWTTAMAAAGTEECPTPRVLASGASLGGYDLAWLVVEKFHGHTLTHGWCQKSLEDLMRCTARMQARAAAVAPGGARPDRKS